MTDLTRPNPGDPLSSSNGKASTVILDEAFDVIEANEDALAARTSSSIITTDTYSDIAELMINPAEATTGWHSFGEDIVDANPGPSTDPAHSQGTTSVQAFLKTPSNITTSRLNINLTEAGFPSGLSVVPGENILVDVMLSQTVAESPFYNAFGKYSIIIADAVDLGGTTVITAFTDISTLLLNTWYTFVIPVGGLTTVRSIGVKKTGTGGSGSQRARWHLDNVRRAGVSPIDQAFYSTPAVGVIVPPDYSSNVTQLPLLPSSLKSLVDLRPDHAWISGLGGVKNTREWGLDETGVTDVAVGLQNALDSLSPGDTLEMPPRAAYRCDHGVTLNVPRVTINGNGAALITSLPTSLFLGLYKNAVTESARIQVLADNVTIRNLRIFAGSLTFQLGSVFTAGSGAAVNGTTMEMDAINESASHTNVPARDHLGRTRQDFFLSDTTHVANDCTITVTDEDGIVLATQTIPLLTSTPTAYTVYSTPRTLWGGHTVTVKKNTGTTNKITLQQMWTYNRCQTSYVGYKNPTDPNSGSFEFAHGIQVGDATGLTVEDVSIEGVTGDGIWLNNSLPTTGNKGNTFRRIFIRGNGRQALAICGGSHHTFEDVYLLYAGRHGVDFEPEFPTTSAVDDVYIHNMVCWKCNLADGFQTSSSASFARVSHITVDGLRVYSEFGGGVNVGFMDSNLSNIEVYEAGSTCKAEIDGRNITVNNMVVQGTLQLGATAAASSTDTNGVVWTATNVQAKNILLTKAVQGVPFVTTQQTGVHMENIRVSDTITLDQTYPVSGFQVLPDTTYSGLDLAPHRTLLPNSYAGILTGQTFYPAGLDMKARGLNRVAYLSGGTTKGNNLGRFQLPISPAASSLTVVFPSKTYPNVSNISLSSTTGGTLLPSTTYNYRFAARNRFGGPVVATANQGTTTAAGGNAVNLSIDGIYDTVTGIQIDGVTVYRGTVSGTYTFRYDLIPTGEMWAMGGGGSGNNKRIALTDTGTTLAFPGGGNNSFYQGYTLPVTGVAGTWTTAAGANAITDETGWEPDTNYAVFVETSWQTTWRVSARRRDGFDLEFGVPVPAGTHTVSYMIARF